jgi:hypothetical protein
VDYIRSAKSCFVMLHNKRTRYTVDCASFVSSKPIELDEVVAFCAEVKMARWLWLRSVMFWQCEIGMCVI